MTRGAFTENKLYQLLTVLILTSLIAGWIASHRVVLSAVEELEDADDFHVGHLSVQDAGHMSRAEELAKHRFHQIDLLPTNSLSSHEKEHAEKGNSKEQKTYRQAVLQTDSSQQNVVMSPQSTPSSKSHLILFWTMFWGSYSSWSLLFTDTLHDRCRTVTPCRLSVDKSDLAAADVVVFHLVDLLHSEHLTPLPPTARAGQVWVLFSLEAPVYRVLPPLRSPLPGRLSGRFHWMMTYSRHSQVPVPYGLVIPRDWSTEHKEQQWQALLPRRPSTDMPFLNKRPPQKRKSRLVAWVVSNCATHSRRESYVRALKKYIRVDVYGKCTNRTCGRRETVKRQLNPALNTNCDRFLTKYKFYLAFENSICTDYVTEKFFRTLAIGVVPVVLGGANYSAIAPANSYIDARNFSPRQLVNLLLELDRNESRYRRYLAWRQQYSVIKGHPLRPLTCGLCSRVHGLTAGNASLQLLSDEQVVELLGQQQCIPGQEYDSHA